MSQMPIFLAAGMTAEGNIQNPVDMALAHPSTQLHQPLYGERDWNLMNETEVNHLGCLGLQWT